MRAKEFLFERNYQQTQVMYQGTSDVFLRTILKQGLIVDSGNRSYTGGAEGSDEELPSLGGVYFTNQRSYAGNAARAASEKYGGRPLMIVATVTNNSGFADEDQPANTLFNTMLKKLQGQHNSFSSWIEHALANLDTGKFDKNIYNLVAEYLEVLEKIVAENPELNPATAKDWTDRQIRERLLIKRQELKDILAKISQATRPKDTKHYYSLASAPQKIQTGQTQSTISTGGNATVNVRITRNIGYRGKTRIILIYDMYTNKIYYSAPELGYKINPDFLSGYKRDLDPSDSFNTIPKSHDPRRGSITQNLYKK